MNILCVLHESLWNFNNKTKLADLNDKYKPSNFFVIREISL